MTHINTTPFVAFALVAMVVCGILGLMLGLDPFGPGQEVRAEAARTQLAIEVRGTANALSALETPQALAVQLTAISAQMTAMPGQQAATQVADAWVLQNAQMIATQTAFAGETLNRHMADQATQTAIVEHQYWDGLNYRTTATAVQQEQVLKQATRIGGLALLALGILVFCGWLAARTLILAIAARARDKTAQAQLLAEQRRLTALRASIQAQKNARVAQYPVPTSLMEKPSDGKDLPRAE